MTLHFYFARKFLWTMVGLTLVFAVLLAMVDFVDHLGDFDVEEIGLSNILLLTVLNSPTALYQILPLLMILSTVALFVSLARSSELVVSRAIGRSGLVTLIAPVIVALLIGVLAVSTANPIVAATSKRFHQLSDTFKSGGQNTLSIGRDGIWLRQGGHEGQTVIHAARANPEGNVLYGTTFVAYATEGGPVRRIEAERAELQPGAWRLVNAKVWPLIAGINAEANAASHEELFVASSLTEDRIRDSFGNPAVISVWDLPGFISDLEEAGFSARRHTVWLHMELAQPLFLVSMVLIAAAFTMRHARLGGTGIAVITTLLLGFGLYYVRNFAQILGENGQIPHTLAAWAPPVAAIMLGLGLLLHMEDG